MTEKNKEFLRMVERLMRKHLSGVVHYGGKIKQINVYFESEISVHVTKDREVVYGSEMKKG